MSPVLHGTATVLRPADLDDADRLTQILATDEVARWWPNYDVDRVRSELVEVPDTQVFVIEHDEEVVGAILYVEEPSPDYRHASVDVFLHPDWHGKGVGSDAIRTLTRHLLHDRGHHRLAIHPSVHNDRAITAFKRVGFREVGVMRAYERAEDGEWRDCLLMDLLEDDLH